MDDVIERLRASKAKPDGILSREGRAAGVPAPGAHRRHLTVSGQGADAMRRLFNRRDRLNRPM
jgi:hypothetical protein